MSTVLLIARSLLTIVFAVAGLTKLADLAGSQQALRDFGVPAPLAVSFGILLPLEELAIAVMLVPSISAWWGALGALALLLLFVGGISYNLARGRTPDCHCFGQLHSAPAGWPTLIRTVVLTAMAALVVVPGPQYPAPNVLGWLGTLAWAQRIELLVGVIGVALLAGEGWVLVQVLSQQGRLLLRIEAIESEWAANGMAPQPAPTASGAVTVTGLPVGTPAPPSPSPFIPFTDTASLNWALAPTQPMEAEGEIELTIGMATYNDFDGVYFTLQALRLYQDLEQTELLVIDNYGCEDTKNLVEGWLKGRYIRATDVVGTAAPRDLVFREAHGKAVLCCDCHVLFVPGAIARLKQFYREHPDCQDLLQGPLLYDDGQLIATHLDPQWRAQMWGTWGSDPRGQDPNGEPFEIPMQGLGAFSCRKAAWLGFHPEFRGFGGEEGYIHEKFRQAGRRCLCLPWLRWMHRFSTASSGVMYAVTVEDKLRNYVLGHAELGLDLAPVLRHFAEYLPQERVFAITEQALGGSWAGSSLRLEQDVFVKESETLLDMWR